MESNWKADVEIDPQALDVEWCKQASLFGKYCVLQADARALSDRRKEALDVVSAKLDQQIRANPAKFGIEKITEGAIRAAISLDLTYATANESLQDAQYELEIMGAAVRALDQKKSALENLVRLQGQNYFAGPSVPRDVGAEWMKEVERNGARDKVKAAMGTEPQRKISRKQP
jgi:hypothetical protein